MKEILFNFIEQYIELTEEDKEILTQNDSFRSFKKGDFLLKEGEYAQYYYMVIKGCVRSYYINDKEEKTTAFYLEKDGITPESIAVNKPSRYYIVCEEDCVLLEGSPDMENDFFKKYPKFESLCRVLTEKELAKSQESFADFVNTTPEERYLNLLENKPELFQRVPQYQIASYIGIKPESLSRIRRRMTNTEATNRS